MKFFASASHEGPDAQLLLSFHSFLIGSADSALIGLVADSVGCAGVPDPPNFHWGISKVHHAGPKRVERIILTNPEMPAPTMCPTVLPTATPAAVDAIYYGHNDQLLAR